MIKQHFRQGTDARSADIQRLLGLVSIAFAMAATYFSYKTYRRRPKLKLYLDGEANRVKYSNREPALAYVHATIANVGKITPHNVSGPAAFLLTPKLYVATAMLTNAMIDTTISAILSVRTLLVSPISSSPPTTQQQRSRIPKIAGTYTGPHHQMGDKDSRRYRRAGLPQEVDSRGAAWHNSASL